MCEKIVNFRIEHNALMSIKTAYMTMGPAGHKKNLTQNSLTAVRAHWHLVGHAITSSCSCSYGNRA